MGYVTDCGGATDGRRRVVECFEASGVEVVFGFPCEQLEAYYAGLADSELRHVHARSEASAALMADGYARVGRTLGVCDGVGGPGAAYTGAGLAEAAGASSPVLALTGDNARTIRDRGAIQDADNESVLACPVRSRVAGRRCVSRADDGAHTFGTGSERGTRGHRGSVS